MTLPAGLRNVNNVTAFGVEWQESRTRYQLVMPRNTATLLLGMSPDGNKGRWTTVTVSAPERFGVTGPVSSFVEFNRIVEAWFAYDNTEESK